MGVSCIGVVCCLAGMRGVLSGLRWFLGLLLMIAQAVMTWATGVGVGVRVQRGPQPLGDGRISGRFFIGSKMKGKAVDGFFVDRPDGMVEIYVNVSKLCRRHKIIVEIPECWRLLVVREAVFLVAETEVQRAEVGSFYIPGGQRAKGLIAAAIGTIQEECCTQADRPRFMCEHSLRCYMAPGMNSCGGVAWITLFQ